MSLPYWLRRLRKEAVLDAVHDDPRTQGDRLLGVHRDRVFWEVIEGGQADFDADWIDPRDASLLLGGGDRALLYAYFNMKGHLVELVAAFTMLVQEAETLTDPVVVDLGCGPGTGCLAVAHAFGMDQDFDYIGVDRASSMLAMGATLTTAAQAHGYLTGGRRMWIRALDDMEWERAPGWRPTIVIASYLLASPTLDPIALAHQVLGCIDRLGRGPAVVLYTNATRSSANEKFPDFREKLLAQGFSLLHHEEGEVQDGERRRQLRYALFARQARQVLDLGVD